MADTREDEGGLHLGLLVLILNFLIIGLVIHSFIIGVNVNDWWKGKSVTPVDHIVTSLGISRFGAQCALTLSVLLFAFPPKSLCSYITLIILDQVYSCFTYLNIWLTSLLSIVLCLKISNLHTRLFLYLRRMILHRTGHLIVALLLLSASSCLMSVVKIVIALDKGETYNKTVNNFFLDCNNLNFIYSTTIGTYFPVLFYSISSILLFTSLYHHTRRMKMSSKLSINLETYYSVMRFVSFTFMYNTIYFIVDFVSAFYYFFYCANLDYLYIVLGVLPLLHSSYLIYRTAKLKDQMSKILHNVMYFLLQRKNEESHENIEVVVK